MKGDFTRDTFDATKHYSRVLMQQGRVTLDADHNEQTAILLHYLRTLARDLIGPYAAPIENPGFILSSDASGELIIGNGRYYVDGILVENDIDMPYSAQPDYPLLTGDPLLVKVDKRGAAVYWVYLDVWERHITALEDDDIREDALNGPDTCSRAKVVWQVRAQPTKLASVDDASGACETPITALMPISQASLSARIDPGRKSDNVCVTAPSSKYRGENQLYRVEIHDGGTAGTAGAPGATFKWSRENGSVAAAWVGTSNNDLQVSHSRGFAAGDWVELSDDIGELQGLPGLLVKLTKVENGKLTVDPASFTPSDPLSTRVTAIAPNASFVNPKIRRWNQAENEQTKLSFGAVPILERGTKPLWLDLEDGVQVQFEPGGTYRTGDYWLIPARVASADVEWPLIPNPDLTAKVKTIPEPLPPDGIEHHYAPIAFVAWPGKTFNKHTCRCEFEPMSSCFRMGSAAVGMAILQHPPADTDLSAPRAAGPRPKPGIGRRKRNP